MLWLKVIRHEGEWVKDDLTGNIMTYGMRYFYDDENEQCYDCNEYYQLHKTKRENEFENMSLYENAKKLWDDALTERLDRRSNNQDTVLDKPVSYKDMN